MQPHLAVLVVLAAMATGPATASVVVETSRVEVDAAVSVATHTRTDWIFDSEGSWSLVETRVDTRLAGFRDLVVTRYIRDVDYLGRPVSNPTSESWISFANVDLQPLDAAVPVSLDIDALLNGDGFAGDSSACSFPQDPWTFCSGFDMGPLTSMQGTFTASRFAMTGFIPQGSGFFAVPGTAGAAPARSTG